MIKSASKNDLFIVLTLQGRVLRVLKRIQGLIAHEYDLYVGKDYPELHITLDRIDKNKVEQALPVIREVSQSSDPIKIKINELNCFKVKHSPRFLAMDVVNTDSLVDFANKLHTKLSEKYLSTVCNYDQWKFHITIVNNIFAHNPLSEENFTELCDFVNGVKTPYYCFAKNLEIWRPTLENEKKVIESIILFDEE